jgi:hypothetical protein
VNTFVSSLKGFDALPTEPAFSFLDEFQTVFESVPSSFESQVINFFFHHHVAVTIGCAQLVALVLLATEMLIRGVSGDPVFKQKRGLITDSVFHFELLRQISAVEVIQSGALVSARFDATLMDALFFAAFVHRMLHFTVELAFSTTRGETTNSRTQMRLRGTRMITFVVEQLLAFILAAIEFSELTCNSADVVEVLADVARIMSELQLAVRVHFHAVITRCKTTMAGGTTMLIFVVHYSSTLQKTLLTRFVTELHLLTQVELLIGECLHKSG